MMTATEPHLRQMPRGAARAAINRILRGAISSVQWTCVRRRNDRGDYGITEAYYRRGDLRPAFAFSFNGTRTDTWFFVREDLACV